jgi:cell division protein ZapB
MTALVGRIPVKGIVTDPYPFKIVISDDNLAANGLRIPHLLQMIVSGYCEGDLNLVSVRGWVTSLTFVFDDGTISSTTSNDNDIGNFTKANSLGYLSDKYGNPFIRGKLITNAPTYLAGNVAMGAGVGAANAYAQSETTTKDSIIGSSTSVTGSQGKFVLGQATSGAASEAQQWWHDRAEQSFDAVYVAPTDEHENYVEIAVNFAKEIHIDYDPKGRKLNYAHDRNSHVAHDLD